MTGIEHGELHNNFTDGRESLVSVQALKKQEEQLRIAKKLRAQGYYIPDDDYNVEDAVAAARGESESCKYPLESSFGHLENLGNITKDHDENIISIVAIGKSYFGGLQDTFGLSKNMSQIHRVVWIKKGEIMIGTGEDSLFIHADAGLDNYKEKIKKGISLQSKSAKRVLQALYNIGEICVDKDGITVSSTEETSLQGLEKLDIFDQAPIKSISFDTKGTVKAYVYAEKSEQGQLSTLHNGEQKEDVSLPIKLLNWQNIYDAFTSKQKDNPILIEKMKNTVEGFNKKLITHNALPKGTNLPAWGKETPALNIGFDEKKQQFEVVSRGDTLFSIGIPDIAVTASDTLTTYTLYNHTDNTPFVNMGAEDMKGFIEDGLYNEELGISTASNLSSMPQSIRYTPLSSAMSYEGLEENTDIEGTDVSPGSPQQYTNEMISSSHVTIDTLIKNPELHHDIVLNYAAVSTDSRALMKKKRGISEMTVRAYRDATKQHYLTVKKPHVKPFVFKNIIIADVSNSYKTISRSSPKESLKPDISYTFLHATAEKVHTLLASNQGEIRLDYRNTNQSHKGIVFAKWDEGMQTYVDGQYRRVKVYDNIQIQKDVENKEHIEGILIAKNKQLQKFLDSQYGYSLENLYPDFKLRPKKKQESYRKYAEKFSGSLILLSDNTLWTDTEMVYDNKTGQYVLEYALDDTGYNEAYNRGLSLSANNLFDGKNIDESYLKEQLSVQVDRIVKQYFFIDGESRDVSVPKDIEYPEGEIRFKDIGTKSKSEYEKGHKTQCARATREIAKDNFNLILPQKPTALKATRATPGGESKKYYLDYESFPNRYAPEAKLHGMKLPYITNIFNKHLASGATVLDIGLNINKQPRLKEQKEKYGEEAGHRLLAVYRPSEKKWYIVDPFIRPGVIRKPLSMFLSEYNSYSLDTIRYYKSPKQVVG